MQASENSKTLSNLGQSFGDALSRVLSDVCEQAWKTRVSEQVNFTPATQTDAIYFKFILTGSLEGEAVLALCKADLIELRMKGVAASEESIESTVKFLEPALEAAALVWTQALNVYGSVTVQVQAVPDTSQGKDQSVELLVEAVGLAPLSFILFCNSRLISSVQSAGAKTLAYPVANPSANLDLVMDVELSVTLRFGQRQLSLREVLDLTSGSVVELDRQVDEPVELVLDGRVVARGEAVIIDGVYGMRITQVLQPVVA